LSVDARGLSFVAQMTSPDPTPADLVAHATTGLSARERRAVSAIIYLALAVLILAAIALVRDLWPPFRVVAVMFFIGWLLAFLLDPMVNWLVDHVPAITRGPAVALTFVLIAGAAIILSGVVALSFAESVGQVIEQGPVVNDSLQRSLASFQTWATELGLGIDVTELVDDLVATARRELEDILAGALGGSLTVVTLGTTIVFIAAVMVASKASLLSFTRRLVPADRLPLFDAMTLAIHRSFGGFIRGQFGLAFLYGLFVGALAVLLGIPFVPFIGVTTMLLQTIPFFGQLVSWIPLVFVTFVFAPDQMVPVVIVMAVGWLLIQNVISPRVMGSAVGLNPLVVLFAVFAGSAIAGPLGAVFGVPIFAAAASLLTAWLDHVRPEEALPPPAEKIEDALLEGGLEEPEAVASA
jgi:predicted PurR-regulated permease PerM